MSAPQQAPTLLIPREKVLIYDMKVEPIGPYKSPFLRQTGLVWTQTLVHGTEISALRVHFLIENSEVSRNWHLKFKSLKGEEVDVIDGTSEIARAGAGWSDQIKGKGAIVELWVGEPIEKLRLTIDKYAYATIPSYPKAITGQDDRRPITQASPALQQLGRAVARLRFIANDQAQAYCTGFLISNTLLVTNEHCIRTQAEMLSAIIDFDYNASGISPDSYRAIGLEATSAPLDYSIIRLAGQPGRNHGKLDWLPAVTVTDNLPLVVVQHPAGEPQQVSILGCKVLGTQRQGIEARLTDFGHLCDTLGGSSGSPVLDWQSNKIAGLHHLGFLPNSTNPVNQAVHFRLILDDLRSRFPALYQELSNVTSTPSP